MSEPHFTQKYAIVQFFEPVPEGACFAADSWPLHATIADTFAIDWNVPTMKHELACLLDGRAPVTSIVGRDELFGDRGQTRVALLNKTAGLLKLHYDVVGLLERGGWKPNDPQFAKEGFVPHATVQRHARLYKGDEVTFDALSLVDMFPGKDAYQREVVITCGSKTS